MATTEQKQAWLEAAEQALHNLNIGQQAVTVTYNGKSVTYTQAKKADLKAYIRELEIELGIRSGRTKSILTRF